MSSVSSTASSSACSSMSAAKRYRISMRARGASFDQLPDLKARRAASTARSMSSAVPADIAAMTSPFAGLIVSKRPPPGRVDEFPVDEQPGFDALLRACRRGCLPAAVVVLGDGLETHEACLACDSDDRALADGRRSSASTIAQPSACTITGLRSISASRSPTAATSAEKRAAASQNASTASGRRWRRLEQEIRDAQASEQPARGVRRRTAAARTPRRPAPRHARRRSRGRPPDRTAGRGSCRAASRRRALRSSARPARADRCATRDRARPRRAPRRRAGRGRTPSRSDLWSMPRTAVLSTTRVAEFASRRRARPPRVSTTRPGFAGSPKSREQPASPRARRALRPSARRARQVAMARGRSGRRSHARRAPMIAVVEQARTPRRNEHDAVQHRKSFARRRDDLRIGAGALAIRDQQRGLARGRVAGAQVVEVAPRGCRRRRRDRARPRRTRSPGPPSASAKQSCMPTW